jgi:hypothetical protein
MVMRDESERSESLQEKELCWTCDRASASATTSAVPISPVIWGLEVEDKA